MSAPALLSASAAPRWINCPGSIAASAGMPDRPSAYADEGTRAHALARRCLEDGSNAPDAGIRLVRAEVGPRDTLLLEQRVDLAPLEPPAAMFGTADAIVVSARRRLLHIIDFKFGAGVPVTVKRNPQLRYYGLGALMAHPPKFDAVAITIVQPRLAHRQGPGRGETITTPALRWGEKLLRAARRALAPEAPLAPGAWCRFCPAQGACPALHERALASAQADFSAVHTVQTV